MSTEVAPLEVALAETESRLLDQSQPASYQQFSAVIQRIASDEASDAHIDATLAFCRRMYGLGRSFDALPFARAAFSGVSTHSQNDTLIRRAATASGLLEADTSDVASAIENHAIVLRMASEKGLNEEMSRSWVNIGAAIAMVGDHDLSAKCYLRSREMLREHKDAIYSRLCVYTNLSNCYYNLGRFEDGIEMAQLALREQAPEFVAQDSLGAVLLRRNFVKLLLAQNKYAEAKIHVLEALRLADTASSMRAKIAAYTTQATFEIAEGNLDVGLTRLESALSASRTVPAALRDTILCMVRGDEQAGNPERALVRLKELYDQAYHAGVGHARNHIVLAEFARASGLPRSAYLMDTKDRLITSLGRPDAPNEWEDYERLAVGSSLRTDSTSCHGLRVGELSKMLALACNNNPIEALEIGLAARIHDIGLMTFPGEHSRHPEVGEPHHALLMRQHCEAGAEILFDDSHTRIVMARDMARYHHAHWDGTGYPAGVARQAIPFCARVCAVADTYDHLVSSRTADAANLNSTANVEQQISTVREQMRAMAGKELDPMLVDTFFNALDQQASQYGIDFKREVRLKHFYELILSLSTDRGYI
jgi:putative two-component system response regulator